MGWEWRGRCPTHAASAAATSSAIEPAGFSSLPDGIASVAGGKLSVWPSTPAGREARLLREPAGTDVKELSESTRRPAGVGLGEVCQRRASEGERLGARCLPSLTPCLHPSPRWRSRRGAGSKLEVSLHCVWDRTFCQSDRCRGPRRLRWCLYTLFHRASNIKDAM